MNRRFRASELSVHEVAERLAPWRGHVDTNPGAGSTVSSAVAPGSTSAKGTAPTRPEIPCKGKAGLPGGVDIELERKRAYAIDAIHTYIWAMCEYDHRRADLILSRVLTTLDNQLDPCGRADHRPR